jgi:hypothetical protein
VSFVHLHNLFEDDKNYYGLLDSSITVTVEEGEHYNLLTSSAKKEFLKYMHRPIVLKELFGTIVDAPEWTLNNKGELECFDWPVILPDKRMIIPKFFIISIEEWLSKQSQEVLLQIAEHSFGTWGDGRAKRTAKFRFIKQDREDRVLDLDRAEPFFKKFNVTYTEEV